MNRFKYALLIVGFAAVSVGCAGTPGVRIDVASNICILGATRKWNGSVLDGVQTESGGSVVAA